MTVDRIGLDAERVSARGSLDGLSGARVLVTGASGLIGTHLLACLAARQDQGARLDIHAQLRSDPPDHLVPILERSGATLVRADLSSFADYARLPVADVIVHAAGYAQPLRFMENPGATLQVGASATLTLLQRLAPGGHLLFTSSAQVYTGLGTGPCTEAMVGTTTPEHPRAAYIEGKRAGEAACHGFRRAGLHATVARLGDVFGPGTRRHDRRALNSFVEQALTGGEIRMLDAGTAVRTYCYVSDAVDLLWRILLTGREAVYNVGGRSAATVAGLAAAIGRMTGATIRPGEAASGVAGAPDALTLDLTRVDREFGVQPGVSLEDGLEATIAWQRQLYSS